VYISSFAVLILGPVNVVGKKLCSVQRAKSSILETGNLRAENPPEVQVTSGLRLFTSYFKNILAQIGFFDSFDAS